MDKISRKLVKCADIYSFERIGWIVWSYILKIVVLKYYINKIFI